MSKCDKMADISALFRLCLGSGAGYNAHDDGHCLGERRVGDGNKKIRGPPYLEKVIHRIFVCLQFVESLDETPYICSDGRCHFV